MQTYTVRDGHEFQHEGRMRVGGDVVDLPLRLAVEVCDHINIGDGSQFRRGPDVDVLLELEASPSHTHGEILTRAVAANREARRLSRLKDGSKALDAQHARFKAMMKPTPVQGTAKTRQDPVARPADRRPPKSGSA